MKQLTLNLADLHLVNNSDFIVAESNISSYRAITEGGWPNNRLLIIGPAKSGKTHLANMLRSYKKDCVIVEDIDKGVDENFLFHTINNASENNTEMLMTSSTYPRFELKDLDSRVKSTYTTLIKFPNDNLLEKLIKKRFSDKQIILRDDVLEYILTRSKRSYEYIYELIDKLDHLSLIEKRSITIPLVKNII